MFVRCVSCLLRAYLNFGLPAFTMQSLWRSILFGAGMTKVIIVMVDFCLTI